MNKSDLKTMLSIKHLDCIMPNFVEMLADKNNRDYATVDFKNLRTDRWSEWKQQNNILDKKPENIQDYVELTKVANNELLFVSKEFALKCLTLKYLP
jgi:hypothetical protein